MKKLSLSVLICCALHIQGCTAHIIPHIPNPELCLSHDYKKVAIISKGANVQSIASSSLFDGQLTQTQVMDGASQVQMAAESLAFECEKLGFYVVPNSENPDLLIEFSIGPVRFDQVAGWIADQAIVRLRDAKTKRVIAQFQAKTGFITPTVENIIDKLVAEIKKIY